MGSQLLRRRVCGRCAVCVAAGHDARDRLGRTRSCVYVIRDDCLLNFVDAVAVVVIAVRIRVIVAFV